MDTSCMIFLMILAGILGIGVGIFLYVMGFLIVDEIRSIKATKNEKFSWEKKDIFTKPKFRFKCAECGEWTEAFSVGICDLNFISGMPVITHLCYCDKCHASNHISTARN